MNIELIKKFIAALIEERDFLCWQLSRATGLIDEESFEKIVDKHFEIKNCKKSQDDLNKEGEVLLELINNTNLDSDLISVILNCSIDEAENVMKYLCSQ